MDNFKDNNFNLLRLIAALLVVYFHAYAIFGTQDQEIVMKFFHSGVDFGKLAVYIFFIISGFLICGSYLRSRTKFQYFKARFLRVYPALIVVALLTSFLLGAVVSNLSKTEYFLNINVWLYPIKSLFLVTATAFLPGVFTANHFPNAVNGSLWTLFWEVLCYIGIAILGFLKLLSKRVVATLFIFSLIASLIVNLMDNSNFIINSLSIVLPLGSTFLAGMFVCLYKEKILRFDIKVTLIALLSYFILSTEKLAFTNLYIIPLVYLVFAFSFSKKIRFYNFGKKIDISYGVYIYAFPIQQAFYFYTKGSLPFFLDLIIPTAITIFFAFLSFKFIEKPALNLKNR